MTKAELVAGAFQLEMLRQPSLSFEIYWLRVDPRIQIPLPDIRAGWGMVPKSIVSGSGTCYELAG